MSGVGVRSFFTASPKFAKVIADSVVSKLKIKTTDPEEIHRLMIEMPLEMLLNASTQVQLQYSPVSFSPVIENKDSDSPIMIEDPEILQSNGHGKDIPLLISFTNNEGQFFVPNYRKYNILEGIKKNPFLMLSPDLVYKLPHERAIAIANQTGNKYFNGTPTVKKFAKLFSDTAFIYPALKVVQARASMICAPTFLYQFAAPLDFSAVKEAKNITYKGVAHVDDLTVVFKTNAMKGIREFDSPTHRDIEMRTRMTLFFKNFISCNDPTCGKFGPFWPAQSPHSPVKYENITGPTHIYYTNLTEGQEDTLQYFNNFYKEAVNYQ